MASSYFTPNTPHLRPMRVSRRSDPFDADQFIYELKNDGFRDFHGSLRSEVKNCSTGQSRTKREKAIVDGSNATYLAIRSLVADTDELDRLLRSHHSPEYYPEKRWHNKVTYSGPKRVAPCELSSSASISM